LDQLEAGDPGGYVHFARIYEGLGHWMEGKDAEALPWMATFTRNPWPTRIVWQQDDITHRRFYWLQIPEDTALGDRQKLVATLQEASINIEGDLPVKLCLRLSDRLLDLDDPITVIVNGRTVFSGNVQRSAATILASLAERADPSATATASLCLETPTTEAESK
jgi:hypothetical protein